MYAPDPAIVSMKRDDWSILDKSIFRVLDVRKV